MAKNMEREWTECVGGKVGSAIGQSTTSSLMLPDGAPSQIYDLLCFAFIVYPLN